MSSNRCCNGWQGGGAVIAGEILGRKLLSKDAKMNDIQAKYLREVVADSLVMK